MSNLNLQILQVSTYDIAGGSEKVAWNLFKSYRERGYLSYLAVGLKNSDDENVIEIPNNTNRGSWLKFWMASNKFLKPSVRKTPVIGRFLSKSLTFIEQPQRNYKISQGHEDFEYPGTPKILSLTPNKPNLIHCHNLHGGYFDLRMLPMLSSQVPIVITLHDAWLLSGHCAHSFDCNKWKFGCENCPDLEIYPKIRKDAAHYNWQTKKEIYMRSRLYIVTPCKWLMDKVSESILAPGVVESIVIPNGVNTKVFKPYDKTKAREELKLPLDKKILLFAANGIRQNIWKDYETLRLTLSNLSISGTDILCLALGEDAPTERIKDIEIRFIPYRKDPNLIARYYQAADIYVHPARVDTFPNTVLEALACGIPVVATNVGGISEQIDNGITGFLIPPGNAHLMASRIEDLLFNEKLYRRVSQKASENARIKFDLEMQVNKYLEWYEKIICTWPAEIAVQE